MSTISVLRELAQGQQYRELIDLGDGYWAPSPEPAVLPLLALAHAHLGDGQLAEELLEQALEAQSGLDTLGRIDAAAVLIALKRIDDAVAMLELALDREPGNASGLARLGYCRLLQQDLEAAKFLFAKAVSAQPDRIPYFNFLAQIHLLQSEYERAQPLLERAFAQLASQFEDLPAPVFRQYWRQLNNLQLGLWVATEDFPQAEERLREMAIEEQAGEVEEDDFIDCLLEYSRILAERDMQSEAEEILWAHLKQYPNAITLSLQLAKLAQVQGHFTQAIRLLQRALKRDENRIDLWVELAGACLTHFDERARKAAEKAVELADALEEDEGHGQMRTELYRTQAQCALARVESQGENLEAAERGFRDILTRHDHFVPALMGLGQLHMQRGDIDEAIALYERVKSVDLVQAHGALIQARRFPEDDETLEKMEHAAEEPSLEGSVRAGILFQLAATFDKRQGYARAFEFARRANAASKKFLPYDGKAHRNRCARIRQSFCRALYEHRPDCGVGSKLPVYVLGMPRSGTTLVEQILSGHSEIFGAGELGLIPRIAQGLNRWERHVGSGRSYPDCIDDLTPEIVEGIASELLSELQEYAPDAKHVIDKLPHNFESIGLIKFLFPNAKIISVRRDPRDIAISNYFTDYRAKHGGMGFAYDLTDIGEQLADHNLLMHHWHQVFPNEILEIRYEDVVDDLEGSARKLLAYIGVEWEPQVLDFNELDRTVQTASLWQVRQPIYKSSKARWARYQAHLEPLIRGTNAPIRSDTGPMLTLPEPGFLTRGVECYRRGDLDEAETSLKKMLHHNPDHAACNFMVGLVYLQKGHLEDGIAKIERALETAPFHRDWREDLAKALRLAGRDDQAAEVESWRPTNNNPAQGPDLDAWDTGLDPHDSFETGSVSTASEKVESRCDY